MLKRKISPPGLPRGAAPRPHLDELFCSMLLHHEALAVLAAAGSGKTVQTQYFVQSAQRPYSWLTLDRGDRNGSRLVSYLAEAVANLAPDAPSLTRSALEHGSSLQDTAASLAESIPDERALVVLDDCEAISGSREAGEVLTAFLDYLPPSVQAVLLSREDLEQPIARMTIQGRMGRVSGADLALGFDEARRLFEGSDREDVDLAALIDATRGWIAAVAFNIRSDLGPVRGPDALASYLYDEVVSGLEPEELKFLLCTSLLSTVTARAAVEVYGEGGHDLWLAVCSRHLPATLTTERELVYHPRFREYLQEQLQLHHPHEVPDLQRRYARHLIRVGAYEDAVDTYLEIGDVDSAVQAAEDAVAAVCQRADWRLLARWMDAIGLDLVAASPRLTGARLRSLVGRRRLDEARDLIRALVLDGSISTIANEDPGVTAYIGWSLQWFPHEALSIMERLPGDFRAEAVRFELGAISGRDPVEAPWGEDWSDVERLISWGLLVQGRLAPLLELLPGELDWPPRSFFRTPHPLLALVWRGEIARARELFDEVPESIKANAHTDLWYFHEAWLCWAEGDLDGALRAAEAAVDHSRRTGFGWEPCFHAVVGCMLNAGNRVADAEAVLSESIAMCGSAGTLAYVEWSQTFLGLSALRSGRVHDAARVLRLAVEQMKRARRTLMLPFAATYLAEAESLLGNDAGSDAAAALALSAAEEMGAAFVLRRALRDVPGVLHRALEGPEADAWQRVNDLRPSTPARTAPQEPETGVRLRVQSFGPSADISLNGRPLSVRRIKVIELVCMMALHPEGIGRQRLQFSLFPDADQRRGGNYFRQVVHKLRQLTGVALIRSDDGAVRIPQSVELMSADVEVEQLVALSRTLGDAERLATLEAAVLLASTPYLPASDLEWVKARREHLAALVVEAASDAADLALRCGQPVRARALAEQAIATDPCAEPAYRVLMECALAEGRPERLQVLYDELVEALGRFGVRPTPATEHLLVSVPRSA